jgi:hypothetical protein
MMKGIVKKQTMATAPKSAREGIYQICPTRAQKRLVFKHSINPPKWCGVSTGIIYIACPE